MEADFAREYQINLVTELTRLSWRRFMVLVAGLGPHSATATAMLARRYGKAGRSAAARPIRVVAGKENAAAALASLFGSKRPS